MLGKLSFTNKIVAKNLGQDEVRVAKVMDFFIRELNAELMRTEHPFIYVRGLGTFSMALKPIETRIRHMLTHYRKTRKGIGIRNTEKSLLALKRILFELFALRRMVKEKRKEIKTLRDARKVTDDNKGKLV